MKTKYIIGLLLGGLVIGLVGSWYGISPYVYIPISGIFGILVATIIE